MDTYDQLLCNIGENQDKIISFCSDIVKISSENPPGDTTSLVKFITNYLGKEGFDYKIYAPQKHMPNIVAILANDSSTMATWTPTLVAMLQDGSLIP